MSRKTKNTIENVSTTVFSARPHPRTHTCSQTHMYYTAEPLLTLWAILTWLENCSSWASAPWFISVCKVSEKEKETNKELTVGEVLVSQGQVFVRNCWLCDHLQHQSGPQWTSEFTTGVLQWFPSWPRLINSASLSVCLSPFPFLLLPAYLPTGHLSSLIILYIVPCCTLSACLKYDHRFLSMRY